MIRELVERLVDSRHRWLIVTGVTFVIALAILGPQVDQLLAERSERTEIQAKLTQASEADLRLPEYRKRAEEEAAALELLRSRQVSESQITSLRSWLVSVARESGCRIRRLNLMEPSEQPWNGERSPLEAPAKPNAKTPYRLLTRPVTLSVTGAENKLLALLRTLDEDGRIKHTQTLEMSQSGQQASEMQLDVTLWYFALTESGDVA